MLSDVPPAPRFLVDVFSFVVHAEFEVGILQRIFISQTTDFHFANYKFSFRKLQIFISFRFVSLHFVSQTTVSPLIGQFNRTVRAITSRALKWLFFIASKKNLEISGEGKRRYGFAEWYVAWLPE